MSYPKVILTAGHTRSRPTEALAELLTRNGVVVAGVIAVSVLNPKRILALVRQHGRNAVLRRFRSINRPTADNDARQTDVSLESPSPITEFLCRHGIRTKGLRVWCRNAGVPLKIVRDLNSNSTSDVVRAWSAEAVIYTGGGILRSNFIDAAKQVLNAHAGPLPEIRGMNAAEWSAIIGTRSEITVHFIDQGIDTGETVATFAYNRSKCFTVEDLRETAVVAGIEGLHRVVVDRQFERVQQCAHSAPTNRQCFIMAPALINILKLRLCAERIQATKTP